MSVDPVREILLLTIGAAEIDNRPNNPIPYIPPIPINMKYILSYLRPNSRWLRYIIIIINNNNKNDTHCCYSLPVLCEQLSSFAAAHAAAVYIYLQRILSSAEPLLALVDEINRGSCLAVTTTTASIVDHFDYTYETPCPNRRKNNYRSP